MSTSTVSAPSPAWRILPSPLDRVKVAARELAARFPNAEHREAAIAVELLEQAELVGIELANAGKHDNALKSIRAEVDEVLADIMPGASELELSRRIGAILDRAGVA